MSASTHEEFEPEFDEFSADEFGTGSNDPAARSFERESPFDEVEEMDLAAELLEITDESELDQFLGKLLKKAARAVGRGLHSSLGQTLGGYLKGAVKQALPMAGGALGNFLAPGVGGGIGSRLASNAGRLFGLELEGLSEEDEQFEIALRLVRLGGVAATQASEMPANPAPLGAGTTRLAQTAQDALLAAARQHAPGFIRPGYHSPGGESSSTRSHCNCGTHQNTQQHSGSWVRHGGEIHLLGV